MKLSRSLSVLVVYEDAPMREAAVRFCDNLLRCYWEEATFEVHWSSLLELGQRQVAEEMICVGANADVVVFALLPTGELPIAARTWIERWVTDRHEREGAVVGLGDPSGFGGPAAPKFTYLRQATHRAGLDYLTQAPSQLGIPFPEEPEPYSERAAQVGSVLDQILQQAKQPPHVA